MNKYLLALLLLMCLGCERNERDNINKTKMNISRKLNEYAKIVIIDSCEYFEVYYMTVASNTETHYNIIHKGNCKNCREFYTKLQSK